MVVQGKGGTTTGKPRRMVEHPGSGARPPRHDRSNHVTTARRFTMGHLARSSQSKYLGSGTPAGVQGISCAVNRRSPPPNPPATSGYLLATLRVDRSKVSKLQPPASVGANIPQERSRTFREALSRKRLARTDVRGYDPVAADVSRRKRPGRRLLDHSRDPLTEKISAN